MTSPEKLCWPSDERTGTETRRHRRDGRRARRALPARRGGDARRPATQPARRTSSKPASRSSRRLRARRSRKRRGGSMPTALVGVYHWQSPETGATFVRFAFGGDAHAARAGTGRSTRASCARCGCPTTSIAAHAQQHRSPLVLRCVDDYRAGRRLAARPDREPLMARRERGGRRHVGRRRLVGRGVAAEAAGLRRRRRLHEELGRRRHRRVLHVARGPGRRRGGRRRHRHRPRGGELRRRVPRARVRAFPARVRGGPHAQPRRAVQQRDQVPRVPRSRARARRRPDRDRPLRARAARWHRRASTC